MDSSVIQLFKQKPCRVFLLPLSHTAQYWWEISSLLWHNSELLSTLWTQITTNSLEKAVLDVHENSCMQATNSNFNLQAKPMAKTNKPQGWALHHHSPMKYSRIWVCCAGLRYCCYTDRSDAPKVHTHIDKGE